MKILKIQQKLQQVGIKIFTFIEFKRIIGGTKISARKILERYTKKKFFIRLKNGLYCCSFNLPSAWTISNYLVKPSYISYETALSYYGIIPETVYSTTSATTKKPKVIKNILGSFVYHHLTRKVFFGYSSLKHQDETILIAEPEKALADYLFLVFLKKKRMNERLNLKKISKSKLLNFAKLYKPTTFYRWVKNVIIT
jgi:predicted transcriptional regulator of viral defense system